MLEKELLSHVQTVIQPVMIEASADVMGHLNASVMTRFVRFVMVGNFKNYTYVYII